MINTEKTKTSDGQIASNGMIVYFIVDNKVRKAKLRIGYHDQLYKIYISPTYAARFIR